MTRWHGRGNRAEEKNRTEEFRAIKDLTAGEGGDVDSDLTSGSKGMDQNRSDTMTNPTQG